jgi:hypothetical protein
MPFVQGRPLNPSPFSAELPDSFNRTFWRKQRRAFGGCQTSVKLRLSSHFARVYELVAQDDAVDLLHQFNGAKLLRAEHTGERERLRTLRDLDGKIVSVVG